MLKNKSFRLTVILSILLLFILAGSSAAIASENVVYLVELEGAITAGQKNYLQRQVENAIAMDADIFLLRMNTPGGLVDATLEINELFLNAEIPVVVYVAPSGAIAGSAGAFILVSADIAVMAPGTTVGAAQPITISPDGTAAADDKTTTFYAAHVKTMAEEKGRPGDIAERFVTENLSLSSREALEVGIIEYVATNTDDLLSTIDGQVIEKNGELYPINTSNAMIYQEEMNLRERMQNWLSDPQISFLILMLGLLGIYFGLSAPGTIVPEVSGAILLVLGIYGIGLFDTNTTGIVLLLLGTGLIIAELLTAGFGIMGIGGAFAMVAGAILLPMEPLMARDWYATFLVTVVGTVAGLLLVIIFIVQRIIHSRRTYQGGSSYFNAPTTGITVTELDPEGMLKARGELWRARSEDNSTIPADTEVEVVRAETLMLWVKPLEQGGASELPEERNGNNA